MLKYIVIIVLFDHFRYTWQEIFFGGGARPPNNKNVGAGLYNIYRPLASWCWVVPPQYLALHIGWVEFGYLINNILSILSQQYSKVLLQFKKPLFSSGMKCETSISFVSILTARRGTCSEVQSGWL